MKFNLKARVGAIGMVLLLTLLTAVQTLAAETQNPTAVTSLLDRIGGSGTADRFVTIVDESLSTDGKDIFVITSQDGKPCIKGNTVLAVTTGINWYLNHHAHVNLAWNNLTTDLSSVSLPLPTTDETHNCSVDYRYYLNYCTFSYSMSTWTWERWQKEIDWMALHGVNMPLQIIGLDVVWKNLLTQDYGYTSAEANEFIAGPCFQAWWGMNNLEGWGGPNPDWWYTRQEALAKKILARERELGMEPVLPGYAGMVPSNFATKTGNTANAQGQWCYFTRPYILDPNSDAFAEVAAKYYARLDEVMGTSQYYSMDPFHEGASTDGIDVSSAYAKIGQALTTAHSDGKWVIQYWQWSSDQYKVLSNVDQGKLIILDLFSDSQGYFGDYQGHDAVYCVLPNFGGRTGLFGRLSKSITDFFAKKSSYTNIKGIGATPEAIEQVPVLYDAAFELPWYSSAPDPKTWLAEYATARYGTQNTEAQEAWELIRNSALNCETGLQGPHEAVLCARPALEVGSVSSWGGTNIFYDAQDVVSAAKKLIDAKTTLSGENYSYDLTDFTRQALTDYGYYLLKSINTAVTEGDNDSYATRRDAYLRLILDLDELLSTNKNFMLGRWTQMARNIADEVSGTTATDKNWLEYNNARTLITTWGDEYPSESGGLRDYSYREWAGMLKDFYYQRWKTFFDNRDNGNDQPYWYTSDRAFALNSALSYSDTPTGTTSEVASTLFTKYFVPLTREDNTAYYLYRYMSTDGTSTISYNCMRGTQFTLPVTLPDGVTAVLGIDLNNDGVIATDEQSTTGTATLAVPADAAVGKVSAKLTLSDGTTLTFKVVLKDEITTARTVSVATANSAQGTVSIEGTTESSVTNTDEVTLNAAPVTGYDFLNWTNESGAVVSTDNPYTYYGAAAAAFTANFKENIWGAPTQNLGDMSTISGYGQYVKTIGVKQNGQDEKSVYSVESAPATLCQTTANVKAAQGSKLTLHWTGAGGLNYCRATAYVDLNCDGDFDDDGEFLAVIGDKSSAGNGALEDYSLDILLPYDVPLGTTHIRLRFDSSWASGWDSTTDGMPAKAATSRMVYDVPLLVTDQSATACTVSVASANTSMGTVDANGQSSTYTYKIGEQIVLRCYPASGYKLKNWTDQYGREVPASWIDGNFLRFYAPESGTYTANFSADFDDPLVIGNWTFSREVEGEEITLTKALSGEGDLVIPAKYKDTYPIVAIATDALQGQTGLTSVSFPSTLSQIGSSVVYYSGSVTGEGTENKAIALSKTLAAGNSWKLALDVTNDGSSYNTWGSGLLATGSDALAQDYTGGFQIYLQKAGGLVIKNGSAENTLSFTQGLSTFHLTAAFDADASTFTVTAYNSDYTDSGSITLSNASFNDIAQLATSIPAGVNLTSVKLSGASDANYVTDHFSVSGDGSQQSHTAATALSSDGEWTIHADVTTDGSSFNEWGSCVLASGTSPFADDFSTGFQFYYKTAGDLLVKYGGDGSEYYFTSAKGAKNFSIDITYGADKTFTAAVTANGTTETYTATRTLSNISSLSYALPTGMSLTDVYLLDNSSDPALFRGCTNLSKVTVDAANASYKAVSNVLYTADGATLLAYPEGNLLHSLSLPSSVKTIAQGAFTSAPELDRIVPSAGQSVTVEDYAFGDKTFYVQLPASEVAAKRSAWGLPVVYSAAVSSTLSATDLADIDDADAINLNSNVTRAGTTEESVSGHSVWMTTTMNADELRPVALPSLPTRVTVEGLSVNDTPASDITLYAYSNGLFKKATDAAAGNYVMQVPDSWTGKTICMRFDDAAASEETEGFAGNAATASRTLTTAYSYATSTNHFVLGESAAATTVYPFHAVLVSDDTSAEVVSGPAVEGKSYLFDFRRTNYITFYADEPVSVPDGVRGAYLTVQDGSLVYHYDYEPTTAVPASTGVIFKSTKGNTYNAKVTTSEAENPSENLLHGSTVAAETSVEGDTYKYYKLSYDKATSSILGFYYGAENGAPFTSAAYKAYLAVPAGLSLSSNRGFALDDIGIADGINQVIAADGSDAAAVYDLTGRKVQSDVRSLPQGIYIVGGKKVYVK